MSRLFGRARRCHTQAQCPSDSQAATQMQRNVESHSVTLITSQHFALSIRFFHVRKTPGAVIDLELTLRDRTEWRCASLVFVRVCQSQNDINRHLAVVSPAIALEPFQTVPWGGARSQSKLYLEETRKNLEKGDNFRSYNRYGHFAYWRTTTPPLEAS